MVGARRRQVRALFGSSQEARRPELVAAAARAAPVALDLVDGRAAVAGPRDEVAPLSLLPAVKMRSSRLRSIP